MSGFVGSLCLLIGFVVGALIGYCHGLDVMERRR